MTPDRSGAVKWAGSGTDWTGIGALASGPVTPQEKLQRLDEVSEPGDAATRAWWKARVNHSKKRPDRFGFNWDSNGCSGGSDAPTGFDFTDECARHDFGYRNYQELIGEEEFFKPSNRFKARVDDLFHQGLLNECTRWHPLDLSRLTGMCQRSAHAYYVGVVALGDR